MAVKSSPVRMAFIGKPRKSQSSFWWVVDASYSSKMRLERNRLSCALWQPRTLALQSFCSRNS